MRRICVFCGSSSGVRPDYARAADEMGEALASRGLGLVYGGGRVGAMGRIARAVCARGGEVIGVIPRGLFEKEVGFTDLPDLRVVDSMHERKQLMVDLADGFVALPGGLGTLEEFFEALTWAQLGLHPKPCGILNAGGYFDELLAFVDKMVAEGFVDDGHRDMILVADSADALLERMQGYEAPSTDKAAWTLRRDEDERDRG